jgi:hypothetical protein
MKLYTEEQVRDAMQEARYAFSSEKGYDEILKSLSPIELPSDEEIDEYLKSFPYTKHLDDGQYNDGVIVGAELAIEWMKNKIKDQINYEI